MKLRYVGIMPVTFLTGSVGDVHPGEEFTVPDELAPVFLVRQDVTEIAETEVAAPATDRRRSKAEPDQSVATNGGDPEKMSEENGDVPNDH